MATLSERIVCLEEDICSGEFSDLDAMRELRSIYLIAKEADELIEEMAIALRRCMDVEASEAIDADHAYTEYLKWKERTK